MSHHHYSYDIFSSDFWHERSHILNRSQLRANSKRMLEELEEANELNASMLKNMEEEKKERAFQKYLKAIISGYISITAIISGIHDPMLKTHFYLVMLHNRENDLEEIVSGIDDLSEQSEAREVIHTLRLLREEILPREKEYLQSPLAKLFGYIGDYEEKEEQVPSEPVLKTSGKPGSAYSIQAMFLGLTIGAIIIGIAIVSVIIEKTNEGLFKPMHALGYIPFLAGFGLGYHLLYKKHKQQILYKKDKSIFDQEMAAWEVQKKSAAQTLAQHPVFAYIQSLKTIYPEYEPTWTKIKKIENRIDGDEKNKKTDSLYSLLRL